MSEVVELQKELRAAKALMQTFQQELRRRDDELGDLRHQLMADKPAEPQRSTRNSEVGATRSVKFDDEGPSPSTSRRSSRRPSPREAAVAEEPVQAGSRPSSARQSPRDEAKEAPAEAQGDPSHPSAEPTGAAISQARKKSLSHWYSDAKASPPAEDQEGLVTYNISDVDDVICESVAPAPQGERADPSASSRDAWGQAEREERKPNRPPANSTFDWLNEYEEIVSGDDEKDDGATKAPSRRRTSVRSRFTTFAQEEEFQKMKSQGVAVHKMND